MQPAATTAGGTRCPVCSAATMRAADVGAFSLYVCRECGCWSSDALARAATASFTPSGYFAHANADEPRWAELLRRLDTGDAHPRAVLDVGCGTGAFLAWLGRQRPAARLAGIELDPERAECARAANPAARISCGDASTMAEALTERFDLITLWDLLEHVPDPARLLGALAQRLAPGGAIFIQTIHEDSLLPRLGRLSYRLTGGRFRAGIRRTHDAHHQVFFSLRGLEQLLSGAGLRIVARWFGRLAHARLDGSPWLTVPASALMACENLWGNGLFVNVIAVAKAGADLRGDASAPRAGLPDP